MMAAHQPSHERSAVQYGRTRIGYAIRRSHRRGTVSIAIDPEQGVLVTAPGAVAIERLDQVVRKKARWIVERLRDRSVLERATAKAFVSGETFRYLGRSYRLKVTLGQEEGVALRGGWLQVWVTSESSRAEQPERVRRLLAGWYRRHAGERLPDLVARWAARFDVRPTSVLVREAPKRWGSCDARGNLRLNWRVVQATPRLIEYVVAHELVHLRHEHHTGAFWATLGRLMPDYEQRRADLRRAGASLLW
jgi:predicted metal-dependent hydrolase